MPFEGLLRDLKVGIRGLLRRPGFALAAILTLALGIGANTAVFSVIQHVLLAPLPYREPDRAVVIWSKWRGFEKTWVSDAEATDYKTRVRSFADAGAWSVAQVNLTGDGDPIRIGAAAVTPNLFGVLGTAPLAGRVFTETEARANPATAVILSYGLWQRRFAGEPVVGRSIQVNGIAREIVGVMPRNFQLPTDYVIDAEEPTQIWLPYQLQPDNRGNHGLHAAARLADGVTVEQANAELKSLTETLGFVVSPGGAAQGLNFSTDFYEITIAGGHGDIPDFPVIKEPTDPNDTDGHKAWRDYLAKVKSHLGSRDINSSLGSQWKTRIGQLYTDVTSDPANPQEAYGIRKLKVSLKPE